MSLTRFELSAIKSELEHDIRKPSLSDAEREELKHSLNAIEQEIIALDRAEAV